jgi:hypothetical protein
VIQHDTSTNQLQKFPALHVCKVLYGTPLEKSKTDKPDPNNPESARKYNAQFNPHIAKQNKLDAREKYWLN